MPWAGFVKPLYVMELTEHGHPRRNDTTKWTEVEAEIHAAMDLIEVSGAHELLTEATIKLQEAADLFADWFESVRGHVTLD